MSYYSICWFDDNRRLVEFDVKEIRRWLGDGRCGNGFESLFYGNIEYPGDEGGYIDLREHDDLVGFGIYDDSVYVVVSGPFDSHNAGQMYVRGRFKF